MVGTCHAWSLFGHHIPSRVWLQQGMRECSGGGCCARAQDESEKSCLEAEQTEQLNSICFYATQKAIRLHKARSGSKDALGRWQFTSQHFSFFFFFFNFCVVLLSHFEIPVFKKTTWDYRLIKHIFLNLKAFLGLSGKLDIRNRLRLIYLKSTMDLRSYPSWFSLWPRQVLLGISI